MEYKNLRAFSRNNFKNNGTFAIIIFIFAGILISSLSLLNLLLDDIIIFLLLTPLLILPITFSFHYVILHKSEISEFNFRVFFQGFKFYFNEKFSSSFLFWRTLLRALLVYILISFISFLVINLPVYNANAFGCKPIIDELINSINMGMSYNDLLKFIEDNYEIINKFVIINSLLPILVTSSYVVYRFSINSISIMLRNDMNKYSGQYLKVLNSNFIRNNRKEFYLADLYLNWPYYLAFVLCFGLGGYLGSLYNLSAASIFTFAILTALFVYITVFGSFRFANKQAIYDYFKIKYHLYDIDFQKELVNRFSNSLFQQLQNKVKDNSEEDTKKDSDES